MQRRHLELLAVLGVLLASPATGQANFNLNWDENISFKKYNTYIWAPRVTRQAASSPDYALVRASIDRYLISRGFKNGAAGDFAVAFTLAKGAHGDFEGSYRPGSSSRGSLGIDIYDTATKQPIWHADIGADLQGQATQQQIDQAVHAMLNRFPPSHGCSHNPAHTLIHACPRDE